MHSEWWKFETKSRIRIKAPIAGGVTSEATTANGAESDLASSAATRVSRFIVTSTDQLKETEKGFHLLSKRLTLLLLVQVGR